MNYTVLQYSTDHTVTMQTLLFTKLGKAMTLGSLGCKGMSATFSKNPQKGTHETF